MTTPSRLLALDLARTAALAGMILYHFVFDLELFGHLMPGTAGTGGGFVLARVVAGSFLALAGFSLVLAQERGIRWMPFARRLAVIGAAAGTITLVTAFVMPDRFVHFGILHAIWLSSLCGLAFLRLPAPVTALSGVAIIWAGIALAIPSLNGPWLWWLGLGSEWRRAIDYVPMFPWFGAFLVGMAAAQFATRRGWAMALPMGLARRLAPFGWPGWHSLAIYLIHQPVLFGLIWGWGRLAG